MDIETRIQQFKQMSEADPENELGHFSLAKAYIDAGRHQEAIGPLTRALELNPNVSKAYQLLGEAYNAAGRRDRAVDTLTRGITVADAQGDRMPREAMAKLLGEWGAPVPQAAAQPAEEAGAASASAGAACSRCGRPGNRMEKPPFKGALGEKILANVCKDCWREWIHMGTKVINELGLVLSTQSGQDTYDQYMVEFLQLEDR